MGHPGPVQGLAGPPGVQPDQVDGGGCGVVFQTGLGQAEVAGVADAGDVGGLGDGALNPGPGGGDGLVDRAGAEADLAAVAGCGGALAAGRAGPAGRLAGPGQDDVGAVAADSRGPGAGDGALGAG